MLIYYQLEFNKLSITNYDQVFYVHAKFQVNRYLIREIKEGVAPPERKRVEKYHLRERVKTIKKMNTLVCSLLESQERHLCNLHCFNNNFKNQTRNI